MANIDPFSSEKVIGDKIVLVPAACIASTVLDDDPTSVTSDPIIVPDGDAELVFLISSAATLAPTNIIISFEISFDGTNFFEMDFETGSWDAITVLTAAHPYAGAVSKGRVVAPYMRLKITATGSDVSNFFTVSASVTRIPTTLEAYVA